MSLDRRFNAGGWATNPFCRVATIELFQASLRDENSPTNMFPALKGRAKFGRRYVEKTRSEFPGVYLLSTELSSGVKYDIFRTLLLTLDVRALGL